ncbi:winged helix-turn-helix domain-containing protein [uncultured Paludibaculum sp.]|uniref:winged helix-turn-helix domain-containing protein n=1 Tax=uncultured Paludibaculum sp. TaxID=1765020 RepID=UPI002AAB6BBF|nr:winged helix-turn-helix domain-containing protein [uncultured Paludibaculum sp.]
MLDRRRIYRFGSFGLDASAKVLLREGEPLHLTRKAAETLLILVEQSPQVVTKEELIASIWPDRVVDEANLAQNIAVVRRALNAEKGEAGYIETFPGRGYRILGPVTLSEDTVKESERSGHNSKEPEHEAPHQPESGLPGWRRLPWWLLAGTFAGVAALAVYLAWPRAPHPPPRITPVTRLAGKEYQPAISPDGSTVAFLWEQGVGQPAQIWIQSAGGSPRLLTSEPGSYSSPAWAPDGRSIACLRFRESTGQLVVLPVAGGPERVVTPVLGTRYGLSNRHLAWSPRGDTIAVDDAVNQNQPLAIFLVGLGTGQKSRLTKPEDLIIGDLDPRFSPDGSTVSFIRAYHRAYQELFTVPVRGGEARKLTSDIREISSQSWSSDNRTLFFASNRGGEFRIWRLEPGRPPSPTGVYAEFPIQFSYSARTQSLIYSVVQTDPNIWRLSLSPPHTWTRLIASTGQDASPQYSPDGARIAFRTDRTGDEQIWVSLADGSGEQQVTQGKLRPSVARWSPDGKSLVFNNSKTKDLYVARQEGGVWRAEPFGEIGVHPVYSPDGQWIYAGLDDSVVKFPSTGGRGQTVLQTRGLSLDIAPDGKALYFVREPTDTQLWTGDVQTGKVDRVLEGLVPYCTSCWAVGTNGVYYLGVRTTNSSLQSIYYLDFKTHATRLIADYPEPILPIGIGPFSLSLDGRSLLTVRLDPSNSDVLRADVFP